MNVTITPAALGGEVRAIPSKSDAHRKLICAALARSPSRIELGGSSADIDATVRCLRALGARIELNNGAAAIEPIAGQAERPLLDCGESGSTFRFMLPVAAAICGLARFTGAGRLPQRPIGDLTRAMSENGVSFSAESLPFETSGRLKPGTFSLPGGVSSQYVTGLMLALPLLDADSEIVLTTPLESRSYVELTLRVLREFGVTVRETGSGWAIPGRRAFEPPERVCVDGDWSNGAFFLCAGAVSAPMTVTGLYTSSTQGDKEIMNVLRRFGAGVSVSGSSVTVEPGELRGCEIDVREIPDLLPVLAVTAACAGGVTNFTGAARLRLKESDRLAATAQMLTNLGIEVEEKPDGLAVTGGKMTGGTVDGCGDHRMVMAAAIAASRCSFPVTITGAEAVNKSYPGFFEDYRAVGGAANVI